MKIEYTIKFIVKCKKEYLSILKKKKKAMDCYCYYNLNLFFIYFYVKSLLAIYKSLYYYYVTTN